MYTDTHQRAKQLFHSSCVSFEKSKLYIGNPPSHSLECNVVFIVCQGYYYKNDIKKVEERKKTSTLKQPIKKLLTTHMISIKHRPIFCL